MQRLPPRQKQFHILVRIQAGLHCVDCIWKKNLLLHAVKVCSSSLGGGKWVVECSFKHLKHILQKFHLGLKSAFLF